MTYPYCPVCGHRQSKNISRHRGMSTFSWEYDFICENCDEIIVIELWGCNHSERSEGEE